MPPKLSAFAARIGLTGLAIAILIALLVIQTVRLEGFKVWPINIEGARPKAERLAGVIDDIDKAQVQALARAQAVKDAAELRYKTLAERIDDEAEQTRTDAMSSAERYIAANRVRCPADRRAGSGAVAAASDSSAGRGGGAGSPSLVDEVVISSDDLYICTVNTVQAEIARDWALGLKTASAP
jgi:hypothetical protein